ncbi:GDP-L-fucose synthase [Altericroceibacterium spongiae]|uniref:GDP-L-fucose synthase n=1 Tax=Altericroceibacterium spongiae TaxID=2320269 RepID=A0A420ELZ6_9SPHN|nr:GDP-L-fucose synthase [Altericroceibacterium spongiae]RKF21703.1 GDP-L-fucose synthase [Altericroceibacterium spongiae]
MAYNLTGKRIYVAGHGGMVGSAVLHRLRQENCTILTAESSLDLREQSDVRQWFATVRPDAVILAAAKVGGIIANRDAPAQFLQDNLLIAANVIDAAQSVDVEKLLFLGSSCIYPRMAAQPIAEEALLSGPLEETNEAYALAKITGIKLCQAYRRQYGCDFISAMPCNLYGPYDNFDPRTAHVLPALIRKVEEAARNAAPDLTLWGSGTPLREFLHVDDCADALIFLLQYYSDEKPVNIGSGEEISIRDLAEMVCEIAGYYGSLHWDETMPDGTPRKLMDNSRMRKMGWQPHIGLEDGIAATHRWFRERHGPAALWPVLRKPAHRARARAMVHKASMHQHPIG